METPLESIKNALKPDVSPTIWRVMQRDLQSGVTVYTLNTGDSEFCIIFDSEFIAEEVCSKFNDYERKLGNQDRDMKKDLTEMIQIKNRDESRPAKMIGGLLKIKKHWRIINQGDCLSATAILIDLTLKATGETTEGKLGS